MNFFGSPDTATLHETETYLKMVPVGMTDVIWINKNLIWRGINLANTLYGTLASGRHFRSGKIS